MRTTTRSARTAVVVLTACAAVTAAAPSAVAIPRGDGAAPGPTQHAGRPASPEIHIVPAFEVASGEHQCFMRHGTWNAAEGPEPTCAAAPDDPGLAQPVPQVGDAGCSGVTTVQLGADPTGCAPVDHWWDFIPA